MASGFQRMERPALGGRALTQATSSTDFWGIAHVPSETERVVLSSRDLERRLDLLQASWDYFNDTAARVSEELRAWRPRGGGRSRDEDHPARVRLRASQLLAQGRHRSRRDGVRLTPDELPRRIGVRYLDAIRDYNSEGRTRGRSTPIQFLIRRTAQHAMDHAWEMEDRDLGQKGASGQGRLLLPYVICPTRGHRIGRETTAALHDSTAAPGALPAKPERAAAVHVRLNVRKLTSAFVRQLTLLAAVGLLVAACGADVGTTTSPPPASDAASSPSAAASPEELPIGQEQDLNAGSYSLSEFPVGITFEIPAVEPPAEWSACSPAPVEQAVCHWSKPDGNPPAAVTFQIVDNVVADPCSDQETAELLDPPVGPSVDDLVEAISNLEGYEATAPEDITVSGFGGKEFTLTAPETEGCGATWATADRTTGMGPGSQLAAHPRCRRRARHDKHRVSPGETPDASVAAVEQVMDSVQIQP